MPETPDPISIDDPLAAKQPDGNAPVEVPAFAAPITPSEAAAVPFRVSLVLTHELWLDLARAAAAVGKSRAQFVRETLRAAAPSATPPTEAK